MTTKCGWCITGHHSDCKPSVTYYDKTWHCTCECRGVTPTVTEKTRKTRSDKGKKRGPRKHPPRRVDETSDSPERR
jgi:hypothetical protein